MFINLFFFSFLLQIKYEPFIIKELNDINYHASLYMFLIILLGLFSSQCDNFRLQTILMILIIFMNSHFFLRVIKKYLIFQIVSIRSDSMIKTFLKRNFKKIWNKGIIYPYYKYYFLSEIGMLEKSIVDSNKFFEDLKIYGFTSSLK